jgi:carboxyl-terminal processing protease
VPDDEVNWLLPSVRQWAVPWCWLLAAALLVSGTAARADPMRDRVLRLIAEHHYLHPDPSQQPAEEPLAAYVRSLDPYSRLLSPEQARQRERIDRSLLLGLGADILGDRDELVVVPYIGGPAAAAGLDAPAYLLAIDGKAALSLEDIAERFQELALGTEVTLLATRRLSVLPRGYPVRAELFHRPALELVEEDGFQLIRIHRFSRSETAQAALELARRLLDQGLPLVLDLRYCPGGSLLEALDLASRLLPGGGLMVTLEDSRGVRERIVAEAGVLAPDTPVILLQSSMTASAAEVLVMVLQQAGRALSVGARSRGKCLTQRSFDLDAGGVLVLSVAEIFDAGHFSCQGKGVVPDLEVFGGDVLDTGRLMGRVVGTEAGTPAQGP